MSKLFVEVKSGTTVTVSQMRRILAQVLSPLDGSLEVTYTFNFRIEDYKPKRLYTTFVFPKNSGLGVFNENSSDGKSNLD